MKTVTYLTTALLAATLSIMPFSYNDGIPNRQNRNKINYRVDDPPVQIAEQQQTMNNPPVNYIIIRQVPVYYMNNYNPHVGNKNIRVNDEKQVIAGNSGRQQVVVTQNQQQKAPAQAVQRPGNTSGNRAVNNNSVRNNSVARQVRTASSNQTGRTSAGPATVRNNTGNSQTRTVSHPRTGSAQNRSAGTGNGSSVRNRQRPVTSTAGRRTGSVAANNTELITTIRNTESGEGRNAVTERKAIVAPPALVPGKNREVVKEEYKTTTRVTICNGVDNQVYRKVEHKWGGVFYFKGKQSISETYYNIETEQSI